MSFASDLKAEISANRLDKCCLIAQTSALVKTFSSLNINNQQLTLKIVVENAVLAKRIVAHLKALGFNYELAYFRKTKLKKNNVYQIKVAQAKEVLSKLGLYDQGYLSQTKSSVIKKECCLRAFLAGHFLASGSVNKPGSSNYHLEMTFSDLNYAKFIANLVSKFNLDAKVSQRRNRYLVYLKKADDISDFLKLVGGISALMNFEDVRIAKDFKNSLIRVSNCEIANEVKSLKAANSQIEDIKLLIKHQQFKKLPKRYQDVMNLRLKYPEASLAELCEHFETNYFERISKSGLKHRFDKINKWAKEVNDA